MFLSLLLIELARFFLEKIMREHPLLAVIPVGIPGLLPTGMQAWRLPNQDVVVGNGTAYISTTNGVMYPGNLVQQYIQLVNDNFSWLQNPNQSIRYIPSQQIVDNFLIAKVGLIHNVPPYTIVQCDSQNFMILNVQNAQLLSFPIHVLRSFLWDTAVQQHAVLLQQRQQQAVFAQQQALEQQQREEQRQRALLKEREQQAALERQQREAAFQLQQQRATQEFLARQQLQQRAEQESLVRQQQEWSRWLSNNTPVELKKNLENARHSCNGFFQREMSTCAIFFSETTILLHKDARNFVAVAKPLLERLCNRYIEIHNALTKLHDHITVSASTPGYQPFHDVFCQQLLALNNFIAKVITHLNPTEKATKAYTVADVKEEHRELIEQLDRVLRTLSVSNSVNVSMTGYGSTFAAVTQSPVTVRVGAHNMPKLN